MSKARFVGGRNSGPGSTRNDGMTESKPAYMDKFRRESERKSAREDEQKRREATLAKTARLKALRLAKEAADRLAEEDSPKKKTRAAAKGR